MQTLKIAYTNSSLARIPLKSIILLRLDKRVSPLKQCLLKSSIVGLVAKTDLTFRH